MMRLVRHPLVGRDLISMVDLIVQMTHGDFRAAKRRLDEIDQLISDIAANPQSGMRLAAPLDSWLVRHGGRAHRITIVFRADQDREVLYIALVAFGGQDWMTEGRARRKDFPD